jgi:hypothetical protein
VTLVVQVRQPNRAIYTTSTLPYYLTWRRSNPSFSYCSMVLPAIANCIFIDSGAQVSGGRFYCLYSRVELMTYTNDKALTTLSFRFSGRAGKSGKGLLVLLPFETSSLSGMGKRRISRDDEYTSIVESSPETEKLMEPVKKLIRSGHAVLSPSAESAYKAFLAYYAATGHGTKSTDLMECGAMIARSVGLVKLPSISEQLGEKLS